MRTLFVLENIIIFLLIGCIQLESLTISHSNIYILNIEVDGSNIKIRGEVAERYIVKNIVVNQTEDKVYINIYCEYGIDEELRKFNVDKQLENEEIRQILLNGSEENPKLIWSKSNE